MKAYRYNHYNDIITNPNSEATEAEIPEVDDRGGSTEFQEREDVELITYINCIQTLSNREDTEVFSAIWAGNLCITKVRGEYLKGQYNNQTNLCIGDCSSTSDQL